MNPTAVPATKPPAPRAVLLIEDDPAAAQRLAKVLAKVYGLVPLRHAASLQEARIAAASSPYDLVLVDMQLPDGQGVDYLAELAHTQPQAVAVVVSAWGHTDTIVAAIRAGARGYLLKSADDAELERALSTLARGGAPIDPLVAARILAVLADAQPPRLSPVLAHPALTPLSVREREVLRLVAKGQTNREIADTLQLSTHTVEFHTRSIYRKLAVRSRTEAVAQMRTHGWAPEQ